MGIDGMAALAPELVGKVDSYFLFTAILDGATLADHVRDDHREGLSPGGVEASQPPA